MKYAAVGHDLAGANVHVPISTLSTIVGGLPGAGKSSLLRVMAAEASFEHDLALVTIDPKRTELGLWRPRASVHASEPDDVLRTLHQLVALIDARTRWMEAADLVTWRTSSEHPSVLVIVDELAELTHSGDKADDARSVLLRRILSLGRACEVSIVAATQRPSADTVPTYLRSLFAVGVGFRLRSIEDARMVLPGVSSDDPGPHRLPAGDAHRGRCFVQVEDELAPREARIAWCSPEHARTLATANAHLAPTLDLSGFVPPDAGAPAATYTRAAGDQDAAVLEALADGPRPYAEVAAALGITPDAARKRLARLEQMGRVTHANGSPEWELAS